MRERGLENKSSWRWESGNETEIYRSRDARLFFHGYLREKTNFILFIIVCNLQRGPKKLERKFQLKLSLASIQFQQLPHRDRRCCILFAFLVIKFCFARRFLPFSSCFSLIWLRNVSWINKIKYILCFFPPLCLLLVISSIEKLGFLWN